MFCALTWDASTFGWAALAHWWDVSGPSPVLQKLLLVGTWPAGWDVSEQPFREALGGALAFEAFVQAVDIRGRYCILRNDAAAAIAAFRKGSQQSPQMQRCALRLSRAAAHANVDCLPWHVPGLVLVAEGIDGASRGGSDLGPDANVAAVLRPAVDSVLWDAVRLAAADAGWRRVTVDAFAVSGAGSSSPALRQSMPCACSIGRRAGAQRVGPRTKGCSTRFPRWLWCGPPWKRRAQTVPCAS
jgi:hypothetical protein